jgi:hypothetical protein
VITAEDDLGYVAGMTWGWTGVRGTWGGPEAERSMDLMVERLGVSWTAITLGALQDTAQSTAIHFGGPSGPPRRAD